MVDLEEKVAEHDVKIRRMSWELEQIIGSHRDHLQEYHALSNAIELINRRLRAVFYVLMGLGISILTYGLGLLETLKLFLKL